MKYFEVYDLDDTKLGRYTDKNQAVDCFLEFHPIFDILSINNFIVEVDIRFTKCLDSYYDGYLLEKNRQIGKIQESYCRAIGIARRRLRPDKFLGAIIGTFTIRL